jgi:hypothetical protein
LVPFLAVPGAQSAQTVWDTFTEYCPGPHTPVQSRMVVEPAFSVVEVACGHATQPDVFNTRKPEEYLPAAQLTHTSELWPRADPDEA